ncbi:MAG TPA: BREX-1 system phosphatase PglZ type A [Clostridia bacterium]|mgnify:CR=1 FL=1|jgi:uncharacterized protein (TIGR02687 family)|nr:BREX-1 system phosphatase PglZ type A [Clostridia bacterium]
MASVDYEGAKKEIESIFKKASDRKIVFWYDAPQNFREDVESDVFTDFKLLVCEQNEFEIKKTIEHDEVNSSFLVYIPSERPEDTKNWLLDILMYSEEYYADTVALTMRRLGVSNTDLRKVIEEHIKFFNSEARTKKLNTYIQVSDNTSKKELQIAMMAVLTKATSNTVEAILTELVLEKDNNIKYEELKKYGFENCIWELVGENYNYEGDLNIKSLIKKYVFTHFIEQTIGQERDSSNPFAKIPSFYEQYLVTSKGVNDAKFFVDRIKSDKRYEDLQRKLSLELNIKGLIAPKEISAIQFADTFECIDIEIIKKIATSLNSGSLEYDYFERIIMNRVNSMWYEKYINEYGVLLSSVRFLRNIEKSIEQNLAVDEYIQRYVTRYYKIDSEYRRVITYFRLINDTLEEFEKLVGLIDSLHQEKYLDVIGYEYSKALLKCKKWEFFSSDMSKDFYMKLQKISAKKLFVIISDALRYEIGTEVYEKIKVSKVLKGSVELKYMVSPLPSITSFGMASLLPHKDISYENKHVLVDGMPTNSIALRDAILKAKNPSYAAISYNDINDMSSQELRKYCSDKTLVYIYHNVIDNAGEYNEARVFDVTATCVAELEALVRKLYNTLQITNYYITADHGFIYRRNKIHESDKYSGIVSLDANETSKRYLITDDETMSIPYTNEIKLGNVSNGQFKIISPLGYDLFKTQGGGVQYIHGGPSLQETIVPVIHVSELRSRADVDPVRPVGVRLKSVTRKITNRSFTLEFEQIEKVEEKKHAITCETFIVDEKGDRVSNEYKFVANSSSDDPGTRITKIRFILDNIQFDRNKPYFLILRDADNDNGDHIEKEQFIIDLIQFKLF